MRTTVEIDDAVVLAARAIARARGVSLGRALSDLARRGLAPERPVTYRTDFPVFEVGDAPLLTDEMVAAIQSEDR